MDTHHLAQINVALARADMSSAVMTGFVSRLDEINRLAENAPFHRPRRKEGRIRRRKG